MRQTIYLGVDSPLFIRAVMGRLDHCQNRRDTGVTARHDRIPLVSRFSFKYGAQLRFQLRPLRCVVLLLELGV